MNQVLSILLDNSRLLQFSPLPAPSKPDRVRVNGKIHLQYVLPMCNHNKKIKEETRK